MFCLWDGNCWDVMRRWRGNGELKPSNNNDVFFDLGVASIVLCLLGKKGEAFS